MSLIPAAKNLQSESPLSGFIPYSHHVTDKIISTKSAEYVSVWKIGGRSHTSASIEEVTTWRRDLNNFFRGIATAHVSVWSHIVRRRVDEFPDSEFDNPFCHQLDEHYRDSFTGYNLMVNDLYLTVVYRPVVDKVLSFFGAMEKESVEVKTERQKECIKAVEDINLRISQSLGKYDPENLGIYRRNNAGEILDDKEEGGYAFSSALEFLAFLVNGEHHPMPVCRSRFSEYMGRNRLFFSKWGEIGEIRTDGGSRFFGQREIFDYPAYTEPGQINNLMETNFEFIMTQSFSALSRHAAKGFLIKQQQNLIDAADVATEQIEEINEALNSLISGHFVMGEHHATITVFGESGNEVRDYLSKVSSALSDRSVIDTKVDLALEAGYWAQLPGNFKYRPRPAAITSLNFLSLSPLHNFLSGKPTGNPWGPAVTILKTVSGTPLYFNYHYSNPEQNSLDKKMLGNTMFTGKSGTGKTVTLGFTLAQAQKFGPSIAAFDKDRGLEVLIRSLGGRYLPLKMGERSGFNPFQLEPTPANLSFLKRFVRNLVGASGPVTSKDEEQIDKGINTLMSEIDKPLRRMSILLQNLPHAVHVGEDDGPATVHTRLLKWCEGGEYGWMFDNPTDALDLTTHKIYGFDVTEFLEQPEIRGPVMMYLIYRTEQMIDGRRFMYVFDEFWKPLEDEYFQDLVKNKQKTIRKQNGLCVFATQEADDIGNSPIASTLIGQCSTFVFLPNPDADYKTYTEIFKLTDSEFALLKGLAEDSRRFLIKQGGNCAVAELNLHGFDDELLVLSGTPETAQISEQCVAEFGEDPKVWLPHFYERARALNAKETAR
ncbi:Type IV secretion system protein virB4 [Pseudomonas fluorescens]|nr:Type IV secretion system protein virB4 [Pseudomonas fluorescens]